jgi:hypothetical protein
MWSIENLAPGDRCTVWLGSGFTRSGFIVRVDIAGNRVLVEFPTYNLSDEWFSFDRLC